MPFPRRALNPSRLAHYTKRHPFLLFGLPFVSTIVLGSFGLSVITQSRYDLRSSQVSQLSQEEALGMRKDRKKLDLREEYFRLQSKDVDDWENKRVERLPGQAEWGEMPPAK